MALFYRLHPLASDANVNTQQELVSICESPTTVGIGSAFSAAAHQHPLMAQVTQAEQPCKFPL